MMRLTLQPFERLGLLGSLACFWFGWSIFSQGHAAVRNFLPAPRKERASALFDGASEVNSRPRTRMKTMVFFCPLAVVRLGSLSHIKSEAVVHSQTGRTKEFSTVGPSGLACHQSSNSSGDQELRLNPKRRRLTTEKRNLQDAFVGSVSGADHVFVPYVDEKYAKAAKLINDYVARDALLFDDPDGPCPQPNWMRVDGRTGRCFKSFDFADLRSSGPTAEEQQASKSYGTWEEAERFCIGFGAHLAALHTAAETRFAHMVLDRRPDACWIGLRRAQPPGRRRHDDPSNGWKWITSNRGILEDSDQLEWTRDWEPVWDSISYGPQLCGVFTRKGIAARRCHPVSSHRPSVEGRRRKHAPGEAGKTTPAGLSCFLCATGTHGSRLPVDSYAYAAEDGDFDWQPSEDNPTYMHENIYPRSGSGRFKDDRKVPREPRNGKNSWILRTQDRLAKRDARISLGRAQGEAEALDGQNYHRQESHDETYTSHAVPGEQGIDRGRLRRGELNERASQYISLPTPVESPSPTMVPLGFDKFNGIYVPASSNPKEYTGFKETSLDSSEENVSGDAFEAAHHTYAPYLSGFENPVQSADELQDSHSKEKKDDLEAEAAWLARTSTSMRDGETYSIFLRRFMELQSRKGMKRKEEAARDGSGSSAAAGRDSSDEQFEHSSQRTSPFPNDGDTVSSGDVTGSESSHELITGAYGLAVRPEDEGVLSANHNVESLPPVEPVLTSGGLNTSAVSASGKDSSREDATSYFTEAKTARLGEDRKRQLRILLGMACGCGAGAVLTLAALVCACVHWRDSPDRCEEGISSEAENKSGPLEEEKVMSQEAGSACTSPARGVATPRGGSQKEERLSVDVDSPEALLLVQGSFSRGIHVGGSKYIDASTASEPKDSSTTSADSSITGRTTAASADIGPAVSVCATARHVPGPPLEGGIVRNGKRYLPRVNNGRPCTLLAVKDFRPRNARNRSLWSSHSGKDRGCVVDCVSGYPAHTSLNNLIIPNTQQKGRLADLMSEYKTPCPHNSPACYRDNGCMALGKRVRRGAESERDLSRTPLPQNIRTGVRERYRERCAAGHDQCYSYSGKGVYDIRVPVTTTALSAHSLEPVRCETLLGGGVSYERSDSVCSPVPYDNVLQRPSPRSESPCTAVFPCSASISDVSWQEHHAAAVYHKKRLQKNHLGTT